MIRAIFVSFCSAMFIQSAYAFILQAVSDPSPFSLLPQLERLGLSGACIMAVIVLWRALSKKDDQLTATIKVVTDALVNSADAQKEMRKVLEESTHAKEALTTAINNLGNAMGRLPCQLDAEPAPKRK